MYELLISQSQYVSEQDASQGLLTIGLLVAVGIATHIGGVIARPYYAQAAGWVASKLKSSD